MSTRARGRPPAGSRPVLTDDVLLQRALEMFSERGFAGASIRELARDLQVSHNLIPQRYGSKERLWYAAVDRAFAEVVDALAPTLAQVEAAAPVTQIRAVVTDFLELSVTRPEVLRIMVQEAVVPGPRLDHLVDTFVRPLADWFAAALAAAAEAGEVRPADLALLYFLVVHGGAGAAALPALARRFGDGVDVTDPRAVRSHAEGAAAVLFDGLLTGAAGPGTPPLA